MGGRRCVVLYKYLYSPFECARSDEEGRRGGGEVSEEAICLSTHAPSAPTDIDLVLGTQLLLSSEVEERQDG